MASGANKLGKLLRKYGYAFPRTEDEVNSFEKKFKSNYKEPKNWPDLSDIINNSKKTEKVFNLNSENNASASNLSMAAREGKVISKKTLEQMKKDKKNAKKK